MESIFQSPSTKPFFDLDPAKRSEAIEYAWRGFADPSEPILFGCGALILILAFFLFFVISTGAAFFGLVGLGLIIGSFVYSKCARDACKRLQQQALPFLQERYSAWIEYAIKEASERLDTASMVTRPDWKSIALWPLPWKPSPTQATSWTPPVFPEPSMFGIAGYYSTGRSLIVVPATRAELRKLTPGITGGLQGALKAIGREVFGEEGPHLDLVSLAASEATGTKREFLKKFEKINVVELFFSDMLTIEYVSEHEGIGMMTLSLKDGRCFSLHSQPELATKVREAVALVKRTSTSVTEIGGSDGVRAGIERGQTDMKTCPMCAEEVRKAARVCRYCGFRFDAD